MQLHHWSSKVKKLREYVRYPIENLVFARLKSSQNMWENEDLKKTISLYSSNSPQKEQSSGIWLVGDENGFQAMKMAFKDFLNKIIVSIWCQET